MIIFSGPYHVANVDILGTYTLKAVCVSEQRRATNIGTITKTAFGGIKIVGIKNVSHETKGDSHVDINYDYIYRNRQYYQSNGGFRILR